MMPLQARFSSLFAVVLALGAGAGASAQAQNAGSQSQPAQPQGSASQNSGQSSSQSQPARASSSQGPDAQSANYGVYVQVDPLAKVRYDNRWDVSLGFAYDHMKAGPTLLQGSNLGGLDGDASFWLSRHWGVRGIGPRLCGHQRRRPAQLPQRPQGPDGEEYFFMGGPEWLGPHNKHGAIIAHVMLGGVYGNFQKDLLGIAHRLVRFLLEPGGAGRRL